MQYCLYSGTTRFTGTLPARDLSVPYEGDGWMATRTDGTQTKFLLPEHK